MARRKSSISETENITSIERDNQQFDLSLKMETNKFLSKCNLTKIEYDLLKKYIHILYSHREENSIVLRTSSGDEVFRVEKHNSFNHKIIFSLKCYGRLAKFLEDAEKNDFCKFIF